MKLNTQPIVFDAFQGGMDNTSDDYKLGTDIAKRLLNVVCEHGGKLIYIGGDRAIAPNTAANSVAGLGYYENNGTKRLIIINNTTGTGRAAAYNELTNTSTAIADSSTTDGAPLDCKVVQFNDKVFVTNYFRAGTNTGKLGVWRGSGVIVPAGVDPAPDAGGGGAIQPINKLSGGALYNVGQEPYQWAGSYTVDGLESNVSDLSISTYGIGFSNEKAELHFTGAFYSIVAPLIAAGKTVTMNVYRTGGTLAQLRRTFTFTVQLLGGEIVDANTSTYAVDNVADDDVSTITAPLSNLPPPTGATDLLVMGNRLFLVVGTRLYFSRNGEPEYFGEDDNGVDDDGGYISPNSNNANPIKGIVENAGIAIVGKAYSKDALYGTSFGEFKFNHVSNRGVVNQYSMNQCDNRVRHIGLDGKVYEVGDDESQALWKPILNGLSSVNKLDLPNCRSAYFDGNWFIVFPRSPAYGNDTIAFAYDDVQKIWTEVSDNRLRASQLLVRPNPSTGVPELLVGKYATDGGGVSAVFTHDNASRPIVVESGRVRLSEDQKMHNIVSVVMYGAFVSAAGLTIRIECGPGSDQVHTTTVTTSDLVGGKMLRINKLPSRMVGRYIKFKITGSVTAFEFYSASFGVKPLRDSVK